MRVSTKQMHDASSADIGRLSSEIADLQTRMSSGKRISKPSDDPVGASVSVLLSAEASRLEAREKAYGTENARARESESTLSSARNMLTRLSEISQEAGKTGMTSQELSALAVEARGISKDLLSVSNSKWSGGGYMFSGYSSQQQPFSVSGSSVLYHGDSGIVSGVMERRESVNGYEAFFMSSHLEFSASSSNSGNVRGEISGSGSGFSLSFSGSSSSLNVQITAPDGSVVDGPRPWVDGETFSYGGGTVSLSGAPSSGDSFTVAQSGSINVIEESMKLAALLESGSNEGASWTSLGQIQTNISSMAEKMDLRISELGESMTSMESSSQTDSEKKLSVQARLSEINDLDYGSAATDLSAKTTQIQAAMAAYAKIASLSLFDKL